MNSEQLIAKLKQYPLALICLLVVLVMFVLIFLRGDRLPTLEAEAQTLQQTVDVINTNSKNSVGLAQNVEQLQQLTENIDSRVIDPEAKTDNYRYFLAMAEKAEVQLVDPSMSKVASGAGMKVYPLVEYPLSVSGEFDNVLKFLYYLRTGRHIIRIDAMTLSPKEGSAVKYNVQASVQISGIGKPAETKK